MASYSGFRYSQTLKSNQRDGRKTGDGEDEFLIFGYSSTLHNPVTFGQAFDEQQHLISWNGDDNLKIDRYDARLHLNSLDEFTEQAIVERKKRQIAEEDDPTEKLEEELCEEQRYADMYLDMEKRKIEEEEQQKFAKRAEIGFNYGQTEEQHKPSPLKTEEGDEVEEDEPYKKPDALKLPVGIITPETMRQSQVIERTAKFVVAQGPQMEVVIKAKQRHNAEQFGFLDFDHRLHPYYKYICKLIREKKYTPEPPKPRKVKTPTASPSSSSASESDGEGNGYLHPLLRGGAKIKTNEPEPGFIGPAPKPLPQKQQQKVYNSDRADLEALIQQHHGVGNENTLYSSLLKGLHSILPIKQDETKMEEESNQKEEMTILKQQTPAVESSEQQQQLETDEFRINDYNKWHMDFYGRPSPYLPGPPPKPLPPLPDSAVESGMAVAAKYVAFHGASGEQKLIEYNGDKVHFLLARSPYYTFYQQRVRELQWQIYQQSHRLQQQKSLTASPLPPIGLVPRPPVPPISLIQQIQPLADQTLVPTELSIDSQSQKMGVKNGDGKALQETDKQHERREKARLFMERILNERMAEKHKKSSAVNKLIEDEKSDIKERHHEDDKPTTSSNSALSPYHLSKAISSLVDHQIQKSIGTPPVSIDRDHRERKKTRRRRRSTRSSSDEERRKRSTSGSSKSEDESDDSGSRKRRRNRYRHRKRRYHHSRSRSRSVERRRRKCSRTYSSRSSSSSRSRSRSRSPIRKSSGNKSRRK